MKIVPSVQVDPSFDKIAISRQFCLCVSVSTKMETTLHMRMPNINRKHRIRSENIFIFDWLYLMMRITKASRIVKLTMFTHRRIIPAGLSVKYTICGLTFVQAVWLSIGHSSLLHALQAVEPGFAEYLLLLQLLHCQQHDAKCLSILLYCPAGHKVPQTPRKSPFILEVNASSRLTFPVHVSFTSTKQSQCPMLIKHRSSCSSETMEYLTCLGFPLLVYNILFLVQSFWKLTLLMASSSSLKR